MAALHREDNDRSMVFRAVWGRLPGFMWLSNLNFGNLFEIDVATQEAEIRIFGHDNRCGDPLQQIDHMNSGRLLAIT